jgi:subtilisin family serine protease
VAHLGPVLTGVRRIVREYSQASPAPSLSERLSDQPVRITGDDDALAVDVLLTTGEGGLEDFFRLERQLNIGTIGGRVATAALRLDQLEELAEVRSDAYVEAASLVYPESDNQVPPLSAVFDLWSRQARDERSVARGKGAIIGIIDVDVDVSHPCLRDQEGGTRVLRLWDQGAVSDGQDPGIDRPYGYGVEWSKDLIDTRLQVKSQIGTAGSLPQPRVDHGTQVASIAGGNGAGSPHGRYVGVAPEADLVIVALNAPIVALPSTRNLLDALTYIFNVAEELKRPVVTNMSLGGWRGPHDATGQAEEYVASLLKDRETRIIVKSSGNTAGIGQHTAVTVVSASPEQIEIHVPDHAGRVQLIELWYSLGDHLICSVFDPTGNGIGQPVEPNCSRSAPIGQDTIEIDHIVNSLEARALNKISVKLTAGGTDVSAGVWRIQLHATRVASSGIVHAWIERSRGEQPRFVPADDYYTATSPAASPEVVVVGSFGLVDGVVKISPFSGRGPSRDGSNLNLIAARGEGVYSAVRSRSGRPYGPLRGTSFATAQAAGAIALMLAANPAGTRHEVIQCLMSTCRPDMRGVGAEASSWGAGAINIDGALACLKSTASKGVGDEDA